MAHKRKVIICLLILFTLAVIFYVISWIPLFRQFQVEKNTNYYYQQLLKLTGAVPVADHKNNLPSPLTGVVQKQISELKTDNETVLTQLTDILQGEKKSALSVIANSRFLAEELTLLDPEYTPPAEEELLTRETAVNNAVSIADLADLVENKTFLDRQLDGIGDAINRQMQIRSQAGKWLNPLWGKMLEDLQNMAENMEAEKAAGQMLMFVAEGTSLTADFQNYLQAGQPGGLIFMGGNIQNQEQISAFTNKLQELSPDKLPVPLLLATDQEGGPVKRLYWDTTPGETSWAGKTENEVCELARQRAEILKYAGINTNFSPVVDLANKEAAYINNRTISGDPQIVNSRAAVYVRCLQASGIFATLKHFPGHGTTLEDSHTALPVITKAKSEWLQSDALPFKNISSAKLVMAGHLLFSDFDKDNAATQSEKVIQEILRQELNYSGVIITDDLKQLTYSTNVTVREALKKAYNSGIDIVLYITTRDNELQAQTELVNLIATEELSRTKVNEALFKILKLKALISF